MPFLARMTESSVIRPFAKTSVAGMTKETERDIHFILRLPVPPSVVPIQPSSPRRRLSQKALKRREPQRHEDTKFFLCLSGLRSAGKKSLPLCLRVFVVQGFLPFATLSFARMTVLVWVLTLLCTSYQRWVRSRSDTGLLKGGTLIPSVHSHAGLTQKAPENKAVAAQLNLASGSSQLRK